MTTPFEKLASLDKLIHEPARLAILTALSTCARADFLFLRRIIGMSDGNLSGHLSKLEEAGLVQIEKQFIEKKPNTQIKITSQGSEAIRRYWEHLEKIKTATKNWKE